MKNIGIITYGLLGIMLSTNAVFAEKKTNACTPPEGKIQVAPNQAYASGKLVGVGLKLTLTATEFHDKDCYCGSSVDDTFDTATHVKWAGGGAGVFTNGDIGSPKTWRAPLVPISSVTISLKLDDDTTATNTQSDGGFLDSGSSINIKVVIPNIGANNDPDRIGWLYPYHGAQARFDVTGNYLQAGPNFPGVSFEKTFFNETGGVIIHDGFGLGFEFGNGEGVGVEVNVNNTAPTADLFSVKTTDYAPPTTPANTDCRITWAIRGPDGGYQDYVDWGNFRAIMYIEEDRSYDSVKFGRYWAGVPQSL